MRAASPRRVWHGACLTLATALGLLGAPALAAAVPTFVHDGGPVRQRAVSEQAGTTTFEVLRGLAQVTCRSGSAGGKIAGSANQDLIESVRFTFEDCTATNNVNQSTCPVHSAGAATEGQIVSSKLHARLVTVSALEAPTRVGLAFAPASASVPFLSFQVPKGSKCVPLPDKSARTVQVDGGVIAAVARVDVEAKTNKLALLVERGPYGEASQAIQHAESAPQEVLSSFGEIESPLASEVQLTFQEGVEIIR